MNGAALMKRFRETSPRLKARIAGLILTLVLVTAAFTEFFLRGRLSFTADFVVGFIEISGMIAVPLLLYDIFRPVNRSLSLLAAILNLVGLVFELLQIQPRGVNVGMGIYGLDCILIGYLIFRSTFVPRILGVLMAIAGFCWLPYLWPQLENRLSPLNLASALLLEGLVFLWLLVMGVNAQRWKEQASAADASIDARKLPDLAAMGNTPAQGPRTSP
jgi:hypothetical protein